MSQHLVIYLMKRLLSSQFQPLEPGYNSAAVFGWIDIVPMRGKARDWRFRQSLVCFRSLDLFIYWNDATASSTVS
jgi:hypothetical protein